MALAGVMTITPNTAVDGLTITQAQDADALFIDCDAASNWGIYCQAKYGIQVQANISGGQGLNVSRNINETGSQALIQFNEDHATSTQTVLNILNDGIGVGLNVYATYVGASHNCMTINHDGNNSNGVGLNIANGTDNNSGTNYHIIFADGDGTVVGSISSSGGTTSYTTTSDSRLKENVKDTIYGLTDLMKLQVKDFKYTRYAGEKIGLVAQDVLLAYPPAVVIPNDDTKEYYGLDYGKFTPLLIKALQELVKRVELLEAK